ncbi:MAG: HlyD family type I secretion periplasmic adaptor subunit [Gammaproteobacteria bacterium]|nr:HlyD family type I secretion periplasmic adaptor subunit [Gammaproteobacteria bacterium]
MAGERLLHAVRVLKELGRELNPAALPDMTAATPDNVHPLHPATNVQRTVQIGVIVILLIFGFLGTWMAVAPLAGAVVATGTVKVDLNRKTVQHLEGGIVKEIRVRDGDRVRAGDTLIVVGDKRVDATVEVLQGQLDAEMAKGARLSAERDWQEEITYPQALLDRRHLPEVAQLMRSEQSFFDTQRNSMQTQLGLLKKQMAEAGVEISRMRDRAEAEQAAAALLAEEIAANEQVERSNYVPRVRLLELKRGLEEYRARRGEHLANISQTQQKITDMELRTVNLRDEYIQNAARQLTDNQAKIFDLEERLRPSEDALTRQHILAPISGTVVDLKVFTIGGIIAPREPLLDIVPDDNPLIVECQIPLESIDNIHMGQVADVRLSAFTRRSTPLVHGRLVYISADRLAEKSSSGDRFFYVARIEVTRESLAEAGNLHMYPGMPAEVYLRTDTRTALDYLLTPITNSMRRSLRDP